MSWKVVAGLKLSSREVSTLKSLILSNVEKYWQYRYPLQTIGKLDLENVSVSNAQILLSAGFPLLLYSAYDIKTRRRSFTFEGYDICVGFRGIVSPRDKRVSFKLNSGLRGYLDSKAMLTGSLLDIPRLKDSQVQVLQVILLTPPGIGIEDIYTLLKKKYRAMEIENFTLPVKDSMEPVGTIR